MGHQLITGMPISVTFTCYPLMERGRRVTNHSIAAAYLKETGRHAPFRDPYDARSDGRTRLL